MHTTISVSGMAVLEPKMQSDLLNVTCIILALPLLLHSNLVDNGTLPVLTLNFWPEKRCCPPLGVVRTIRTQSNVIAAAHTKLELGNYKIIISNHIVTTFRGRKLPSWYITIVSAPSDDQVHVAHSLKEEPHP